MAVMIEAVLKDGGATLASGARGSSGVSADIAHLPGTPKLSPTVVLGEGLLRRAIRSARSVARRNTETTFVGGVHQLRKGKVERAHFPKEGRIICSAGSLWITADGGGEDVILSAGEFRWFRAGAWLLIEAIARAEFLIEA
jgi:quercetin dioxygenase-like cupin family protein